MTVILAIFVRPPMRATNSCKGNILVKLLRCECVVEEVASLIELLWLLVFHNAIFTVCEKRCRFVWHQQLHVSAQLSPTTLPAGGNFKRTTHRLLAPTKRKNLIVYSPDVRTICEQPSWHGLYTIHLQHSGC